MRNMLVEAVGTFFLVLIIVGAVASGSPGAPFAIGVGLMVLIYWGGHLSGAHYNPAATLALLLRGRITPVEAGKYVAAQLVGGVLGAIVGQLLTGQTVHPEPGAEVSLLRAAGAEVLFTFLLTAVILQVATNPKVKGNQYYGAAIAGVVVAGAFTTGGIGGACFNPAVGVGLIVNELLHAEGEALKHLPLYVLAPLVGGLLAGLTYGVFSERDEAPGAK